MTKPLTINLRHLEKHSVNLLGELAPADLDLDVHDELICARHPLHYDLEIEMLDDGMLVQGMLQTTLDCQCARCLKDFKFELELDPWTLHLPLAGEDAAAVHDDCVDLTPLVREDILLKFPQHPLCSPDCSGLKKTFAEPAAKGGGKSGPKPAAWAELNKLKL